MRSKLHLPVCLLGLGAALLLAGPAHAAFHLMEIEQVIGGVAGDTTAQAVQLKMRTTGQNVLSGTVRLVARDAAGGTPVVLSTLGAGINSGACDAGGEILLATDGFVNRTTPAAVRDFSMLPIPAAYLPAGSLTFENAAGTLIYWRLSWGGAAYTGVGTTTIDNGDGDVNPAVAGPLPSSGVQALRVAAGCPAATSNAHGDGPARERGPGAAGLGLGRPRERARARRRRRRPQAAHRVAAAQVGRVLAQRRVCCARRASSLEEDSLEAVQREPLAVGLALPDPDLRQAPRRGDHRRARRAG
jgi:hypothetical protein